MRRIALHGLDQIGHQIGPPPQLHVDAAPAFTHHVAHAHQIVENLDDEDHDRNRDTDDDPFHAHLPFRPTDSKTRRGECDLVTQGPQSVQARGADAVGGSFKSSTTSATRPRHRACARLRFGRRQVECCDRCSSVLSDGALMKHSGNSRGPERVRRSLPVTEATTGDVRSRLIRSDCSDQSLTFCLRVIFSKNRFPLVAVQQFPFTSRHGRMPWPRLIPPRRLSKGIRWKASP